jgi:two-component system cell cycle sensor histidine kinase/response regulator CckA
MDKLATSTTVGSGTRPDAEAATTLLAAIVESSSDGIIAKDLNGIVTSWNRGAERMFGYAATEIIGRPITLILPADRLAEEDYILERIRRGERVEHFETIRQRKDGSLINVSVTISPIRNAQGGVIGASKVARDITEKRLAEDALRKSEERFSKAFRASPMAIAISTYPEGRYVDVNDYFIRTIGYERDEVLGRRALDLGIWARPEQRAAVIARIAAGETVRDVECLLRTKSGELRTVIAAVEQIVLGDQPCLLFINCDITERQRAEAALHQSESRLRAVVDNIEEMIWVAVPGEVRPIYVSPACRKIWGCPEHELVNHPTRGFDSIHPDDRARFLEGVRRQLAGEKTSIEFRIRRPDGTVRWVWDQAFPVTDASGKVTSMNGIVADVTERKQLEEQLRQSQKLEAIGQLAGGIAHDFNNLLTVIQCNANLLLGGDRAPADETSASVAQILVAAERAADLTRQLLLFSRKQALHTADLDLREIVRNLAGMLRRLVGEDIVLEVDCAADLPLMHGDRTMVEQVLLNLVVNARDAMPRGGRLSLATSLVVHDPAKSAAGAEAGPGTFVRLSVADTGTGIAPEHRPHIFEPFFTTKAVGKGTGLGLATVYGIVKQHRGWIDLQSTPGLGTTFHVHFLATERPAMARPAAVAVPPNELPRGDEAILLVEDEPALRALAKRALQRCGYTVHEAASGVAALEVWAAHRATIKLLLSDMVMPDGLTGLELATRLQAEDPNLRVVLTSGYSPDNPEAATASFLAKPYSPIKLARIVRECLDGK